MLAGLVAIGGAVAAALLVTNDGSTAGADQATVELSSVTIDEQARLGRLLRGDRDPGLHRRGEHDLVAGCGDSHCATSVRHRGAGGHRDRARSTAHRRRPDWRRAGAGATLDTDSDDGVDVRQLETNLVALGYDPDGDIEIDEAYDGDRVDRRTLKRPVGLDEPDGVCLPPGRSSTCPARCSSARSPATRLVRRSATAVLPCCTGRSPRRRLPGVGDESATEAWWITLRDRRHGGVAAKAVLFWHGGLPVVAIEGDVASIPAALDA